MARSRHYNKRLKECGVNNSPVPYNKADLLVDTDSKLVHDFVLRTKPRHDMLGARSMFKRFKPKDCLVIGDRGYDSEELHQMLADSGNEFYAPVRDFKVKKPGGRHRRKCIKLHDKYYQRNIVESVNFSLKSRLQSLQSLLHFMKKREFAWKLVTYNLEKLSDFLQLIKNACLQEQTPLASKLAKRLGTGPTICQHIVDDISFAYSHIHSSGTAVS